MNAPDSFARVANALRERWHGELREARDHATDIATDIATEIDTATVTATDTDSIGEWRDNSARQRNLLLDACGSDHRALVELLLSSGETVRSALDVHSDERSALRWETRRAPIVHKLVSTRYLQPDVARWIVDCWAYASDVRADLPESPAMQFVDARDNNASAERTASTMTGGGAGAATNVPSFSPWRRGRPASHATANNTIVNAGGAQGSTMRVAPSATGAVRGTTRGRMTPAELARIKRMERVSLVTLAGALVFGFVAHGYALWSKPLQRAGTATAVGGGTTTAVGAGTATAVGGGTTPAVGAGTTTAVGAGTTAVGGAVASTAVKAVPSTAVKAVPATAVKAVPATAVKAVPATAVKAVPATAVKAVPATAVAVPAVAVPALSGRYVVTHRNVSVIGGDGCDNVARALARREPSIESISTDANASSIHLVDRGVTGRLERDGRFATGPDSGVTDGVRWTFRMVGRFTDTGFVASTQKTTDAIIGWHKSRSCSVVAELTGHRLAR